MRGVADGRQSGTAAVRALDALRAWDFPHRRKRGCECDRLGVALRMLQRSRWGRAVRGQRKTPRVRDARASRTPEFPGCLRLARGPSNADRGENPVGRTV